METGHFIPFFGGAQWRRAHRVVKVASAGVITILLLAGGRFFPDLTREIETNVIYVSRRRTCGADRSVRTETLRFQNLFVFHRAVSLDAPPRTIELLQFLRCSFVGTRLIREPNDFREGIVFAFPIESLY